jgi:hypothetical protein
VSSLTERKKRHYYRRWSRSIRTQHNFSYDALALLIPYDGLQSGVAPQMHML